MQFDFKEGLEAGEIRILDTTSQNLGISDFVAQNGRVSFGSVAVVVRGKSGDISLSGFGKEPAA